MKNLNKMSLKEVSKKQVHKVACCENATAWRRGVNYRRMLQWTEVLIVKKSVASLFYFKCIVYNTDLIIYIFFLIKPFLACFILKFN